MPEKELIAVLKKNYTEFFPLIHGLTEEKLMPLDLSDQSILLKNIDLKDTRSFHNYLFGEVLQGRAGIGGFFENRTIYQRSSHYDGAEARSLHLGLDIWMDAGTLLHSPLPGTIHSLQDNQGFGNYGPTIITQHQLEGEIFYVLYGHLDSDSLNLWQAGDSLEAGQLVGYIGDFPENGDWPPHLHWQLITDMLGQSGDFPGVAAPSERDYYLQFCVNPEYLLKLEK